MNAPLSLESSTRPPLPNAEQEAFSAVNRHVLHVLECVCRAECVDPPLHCDANDPAAVRREVVFSLDRLGYFPRRDVQPRTDREMLTLLREALPVDAEDLALIFALRALTQTNLTAAQMEVAEAERWGRLAVLSPL